MKFRTAILVTAFVGLIPRQLPAQGIFEGFGFPKVVTATGHTEVLGSVHVALRLGTVSSDTLVIDVSPLRITNTSAADIRVTTSGNITTGAVTIEAEEGRVRVPVSAGGTTGSLRVDGIRVSVSGTNSSAVTARLSWASRQNVLSAGESVIVVDQVKSGLAVDPMTDHFRIFNSNVIDGSATIVAREGYNSAFTNSTDFGQNTPMRIRVRVSDFPTGLRMRFPAVVTANESAATLTTVEGTPVDIPREDGSTDVTYNFNGSGVSAGTLESFNIVFTVSTTGPVENLQPTIELGLAPIGAAVPTTALPATNVPRYAEENLVALEGTSRIITKTLYWTGIDSSRQNRLAVYNPSSTNSNLILSGFTAAGELLAGANISNPVRLSLGANQSLDQALTEVFGAGATNIATVRVQSTGSDVVALGTASATGVSEAVALSERAVANFLVPSINESGRVYVFNPRNETVSGTLTLSTSEGLPLATKTISVAGMAAASGSIQELFGVQSDGQIRGSFGGPVIALESFGTSSTLNFVAAQVPVGLPSLYVPFFASGGGYETDLNVINSSDQAVTLSAKLVDSQGSPVAAPRSITLAPSQQLVTSISQLFQMQSFASGYVKLDVPQVARGFWTFYPAITGYARIRSGQSASTVIPLSGYPQPTSSIPTSGVTAGQFQGIALVNPTDAPVTVNLLALSPAGTVLATASVNLAAGQISSKLITEYFSVAIGEHSVIRVNSSAPVVATSITGSSNGDALRAVSALR